MWLKENEFTIRLGGNTYIDCQSLITFNGEPLFDVRRNENDGQVAIDCEIYGASGLKLASIKRSNIYTGNDLYDVERSGDQIILREKASGERRRQ